LKILKKNLDGVQLALSNLSNSNDIDSISTTDVDVIKKMHGDLILYKTFVTSVDQKTLRKHIRSSNNQGSVEGHDAVLQKNSAALVKILPRLKDTPSKNKNFLNTNLEEVWRNLFGTSVMISNKDFFEGFKKLLIYDDKEQAVIEYMLDPDNNNKISVQTFLDFFNRFGKKDPIANLRLMTSYSWFYPKISPKECEILLRDQVPGTFLVSIKNDGSLNLSIELEKKKVSHNEIKCNGESYYIVNEKKADEFIYFADLFSCLGHFERTAKTPLNTDIPFQPWFFGDVDKVRSEEMLLFEKVGTYLIRFSSSIGDYALSFKSSSDSVTHYKIDHEGINGNLYQVNVDGVNYQFNTLPELLSMYNSSLTTPYGLIRYKKACEAFNVISKWKYDMSYNDWNYLEHQQ